MLQYKINVIEELAKVGINTTKAKKYRAFRTSYNAKI